MHEIVWKIKLMKQKWNSEFKWNKENYTFCNKNKNEANKLITHNEGKVILFFSHFPIKKCNKIGKWKKKIFTYYITKLK
jgi:hypothetical protein